LYFQEEGIGHARDIKCRMKCVNVLTGELVSADAQKVGFFQNIKVTFKKAYLLLGSPKK